METTSRAFRGIPPSPAPAGRASLEMGRIAQADTTHHEVQAVVEGSLANTFVMNIAILKNFFILYFQAQCMK